MTHILRQTFISANANNVSVYVCTVTMNGKMGMVWTKVLFGLAIIILFRQVEIAVLFNLHHISIVCCSISSWDSISLLIEHDSNMFSKFDKCSLIWWSNWISFKFNNGTFMPSDSRAQNWTHTHSKRIHKHIWQISVHLWSGLGNQRRKFVLDDLKWNVLRFKMQTFHKQYIRKERLLKWKQSLRFAFVFISKYDVTHILNTRFRSMNLPYKVNQITQIHNSFACANYFHHCKVSDYHVSEQWFLPITSFFALSLSLSLYI